MLKTWLHSSNRGVAEVEGGDLLDGVVGSAQDLDGSEGAVVRGAELDDARDAVGLGQESGAGDEPAHAVGDERDIAAFFANSSGEVAA